MRIEATDKVRRILARNKVIGVQKDRWLRLNDKNFLNLMKIDEEFRNTATYEVEMRFFDGK